MRRASSLVVVLALVALPHAARADDVCGEGYTQAQMLRRAGKLRAAKQALVSCSQEICSSAVRVDCFKWTEEVERALSTVVFDVRLSDGVEVTDVRVYAGDELLAPSLDGRQIPMDPGETVLRFVRGAQSLEKRAIIREGEKFRAIHIELPSAPAPRVDIAAPRPALASAPAPSSVPTLSWILGGVGVAGLATFGVLASVGYANESALRGGCFTTGSCDHSDVSAVRTQYLVGDIALAVGVVSLAVAATYWALHGATPAAASVHAGTAAPWPRSP